jgi:beta-glucosidase-like glycosyl hydrolase/CubicO group peptidase (beta-lactamase class C family)
MGRFLVASILVLLLCQGMMGQFADPLMTRDSIAQRQWTDSIMAELSVDEKIGQLFMVQAYSNKDVAHKESIRRIIRNHHVGGLIFMQGSPIKQALLTNTYQSISKVPLLISIDAEWGLDMRLEETYRFPWNMTLGAVQDLGLIEKFGSRLGEQCRRLGIHMNFAPVVDINTNPKNPIIGNRSFGEEPESVTQKSAAFLKGMQSQAVLATAKHFPGHGDTETDSHKTLPRIAFDRQRLDGVELYPYRELVNQGLTGVMIAHLSVPAVEPNQDLPTSLSYHTATTLLQDQLGFKGLVVTDALNMKGVSDVADPGEVDLAALLAGNDILLIPQDIPAAVEKIKTALKSKVLSEERLDLSVRKILSAKYCAGLHRFDFTDPEDLVQDLNSPEDEVLHRSLVEKSITVVKNTDGLLPIRDLERERVAYVKLGDSDNQSFVEMLNHYTRVDVISGDQLDDVVERLKDYSLVVIGFHKSNAHPWKGFDLSSEERVWLQEIARNNKVVLNVFASPYSLNGLRSFTNIEGIVISYQNSRIAQESTGQVLFGAKKAEGRLPVSIGDRFRVGQGIETETLNRLGYSVPEAVGLSSSGLKRIDSVAQVVIAREMAPGLQVLVARKGQVVYHKAFGTHTFRKEMPVKKTDLYDLASMTKILAALPLIMELEERGVLNLDATLGSIIPEMKGSNKENLVLRDIFSHTAQLKAWIPFYLETLDSITQEPLEKYYRTVASDTFDIEVAKNLYLRSDYADSIRVKIRDSEQRTRPGYRYSDLSFYILRDFMEKHYGSDLNELTTKHFYGPMGARSLTYLPLDKYPERQIVPSEDDRYFRYQELRGYVHDMGAAMFGGIGGHAGLFGNANDVAKMMQMYLQGGSYGGNRYFDPETIAKFNYRYYAHEKNRRGLIFDKPQIKEEEDATCDCVSDESFGHSGFTGTYTWADPETEIIYVFLSNRVYPTMDNRKMISENIRTEVQHIIQEAILDEQE